MIRENHKYWLGVAFVWGDDNLSWGLPVPATFGVPWTIFKDMDESEATTKTCIFPIWMWFVQVISLLLILLSTLIYISSSELLSQNTILSDIQDVGMKDVQISLTAICVAELPRTLSMLHLTRSVVSWCSHLSWSESWLGVNLICPDLKAGLV